MYLNDKYYLERLGRVQRESVAANETHEELAKRFLKEFEDTKNNQEPIYITNMRTYFQQFLKPEELLANNNCNIDYSFFDRKEQRDKIKKGRYGPCKKGLH